MGASANGSAAKWPWGRSEVEAPAAQGLGMRESMAACA